MKRRTFLSSLPPLAGLFLLSGCGASPDVAMMKAGMEKSGMAPDQAACFAKKLADAAKGDPYNYMAGLMKEDFNESEAISKTRRKYGAEFSEAVRDARKACADAK